jgi:hypothetical protein
MNNIPQFYHTTASPLEATTGLSVRHKIFKPDPNLEIFHHPPTQIWQMKRNTSPDFGPQTCHKFVLSTLFYDVDNHRDEHILSVVNVCGGMAEWHRQGKPKYLEKILSQRHFIYQKSYTNRSGIETRLPRWDPGDWPAEPWHDLLYYRHFCTLFGIVAALLLKI